jgi:DNA-directed RNA polymerase subunit alpha
LLNSVTPKIEVEALTKNYGRFVIGPLDKGYGITIGNALRRVLLSSLPGAAVTSLRVSEVTHEFSEIPNAKEDMTQLILTVKQLRLRSYSDGPVTLQVAAAGNAVVTAGDIETVGDVEIINPELQLLTLDSPDEDLEIELVVEKGRGYSPADEREGLPIGQIPVDAIFSPIRKASYHVEPARIGQMTNFDRLILDIWTDGTMAPAEAMRQAAQILVTHLNTVAAFGVEEAEAAVEEEEEVEEEVPTHIAEMPIEELDLSVRAYNCLKRAGIANVGQVLAKLEDGPDEMLAIRNFGQKSLEELLEKLQAKDAIGEVMPWEEEEEAEESEEAEVEE